MFCLWEIIFSLTSAGQKANHQKANQKANHQKAGKRCVFLRELGYEVVKSLFDRRSQVPNLYSTTREAMASIGVGQPGAAEALARRKHCSLCLCNTDRKVSHFCVVCNKPVHCVHSTNNPCVVIVFRIQH